jgi:hypothetical protein
MRRGRRGRRWGWGLRGSVPGKGSCWVSWETFSLRVEVNDLPWETDDALFVLYSLPLPERASRTSTVAFFVCTARSPRRIINIILIIQHSLTFSLPHHYHLHVFVLRNPSFILAVIYIIGTPFLSLRSDYLHRRSFFQTFPLPVAAQIFRSHLSSPLLRAS